MATNHRMIVCRLGLTVTVSMEALLASSSLCVPQDKAAYLEHCSSPALAYMGVNPGL